MKEIRKLWTKLFFLISFVFEGLNWSTWELVVSHVAALAKKYCFEMIMNLTFKNTRSIQSLPWCYMSIFIRPTKYVSVLP